MGKRQEIKKQNIRWVLISALTVILYLLLLSRCFGFWYNLNDDIMIKSITSGLYTGIPERHNIQMQYPLSLILSSLYRLSNQIPWYDIFLVSTQALCLILIFYRTSEMISNQKSKAAVYIASSVIIFALITDHMVFYQYTISCAFLSGTAAFLLLTSVAFGVDDGEDTKGVKTVFTANNIAIVILLVLAYLIRSEMMLLTFPMIMVTFLFRVVFTCASDIGIARKQAFWRVFKKYLLLFITLVIGVGMSAVLNVWGNAEWEWKVFNRFFDARTELYDFHSIPPYEGNEEFYQSVGLTKASQKLLENYNYGLNEALDAKTLEEIAVYSEGLRRADGESIGGRIQRAGQTYIYRLTHPFREDESPTDVFWKLTILVAYLLVLLMGVRHHILWKLLLLFACRSTLWLYILARNRVPVRISHALYFVEYLILLALLLVLYCRFEAGKQTDEKGSRRLKIITDVILILPVILFVFALPQINRLCIAEKEYCQENSQSYDILFQYMREQPDAYFYVDVYSWVPYTEHLFNTGAAPNYDIMGGWVTFSPLYEKNIKNLGVTCLREALLSDQVFYVQKTENDIQWLKSYYNDCGEPVRITRVAEVGLFTIFKLKPEDS